MIEDEEIKTQISPFAIREGEVKVFDGKRWVCVNEPNCTQNKYWANK